jgi:hypothetical protein
LKNPTHHTLPIEIKKKPWENPRLQIQKNRGQIIGLPTAQTMTAFYERSRQTMLKKPKKVKTLSATLQEISIILYKRSP